MRLSFALAAALLTPVAAMSAQQSTVDRDSAQIRTTLRAFYFNLAHQDWEAMAADILPAKVVAHRPAPEAFVMAASSGSPPSSRRRPAGSSPASDESPECAPEPTSPVDQATITLDGAWAEVSVPSCTAGGADADEFRLIRFERRWRLVYIDLEKGRPAGLSE